MMKFGLWIFVVMDFDIEVEMIFIFFDKYVKSVEWDFIKVFKK